MAAVRAVPTLLTVKEAASALSISEKSVWRLVDCDKIHAIDMNGGRNHRRQLRIPADELHRFLGDHSTSKPKD
jgi:excisionase family DNA binding protein